MSETVQLRFDYAALDAATRGFVLERTERIHNLARMTAVGIVQIGQYLTEVKERLEHGQFLEWVEREFGWVERSAQRFMSVYQHVKSDKLSDLAIDVSALYLIAAPSTPEPVRAEVIRRAENGESVSHAGTRELVRRFGETGEIPDIKTTLPEMIAERRRALSPPEPPPRITVEERREETRLRQEIEANTRRAAAMMGVVRAIEDIAETNYSMAEIGSHITEFDTPDQDWRGAVRKSLSRLRDLTKELGL